jgi:hypothetical protein
MSFSDWYTQQFAETLSEPLSESDGMVDAEIESLLDGRTIPLSLRDYYLVAGRHWMNTNYDRLLQPNELRTEDSHTIFMDENQCVSHWAFKNDECSHDDPSVYQGQFESERLVWYPLDQTLSQFVIDSWLETCTGGDD